MTLSVIIPTLNEAEKIGRLVKHLQHYGSANLADIIVVDAGSNDNTVTLAGQAGATILKSPGKGRPIQMNYGAERSTGDILYFVHADTLPPVGFATDIIDAVNRGYPVGCYRFQFDSQHPLLKINAWFTRFSPLWCRGGDQSLYVQRSTFKELGGFCPDHVIMEDYEFIDRARKRFPFHIIPKNITVSARKYEQNSYLRVQLANLLVFNLYRFGVSPQQLQQMYRKLLDYR